VSVCVGGRGKGGRKGKEIWIPWARVTCPILRPSKWHWFTKHYSPILLVTVSLPVMLPLSGTSPSSLLVLMLSTLWLCLSSSWSRWLCYLLRKPPLLRVGQPLTLHPPAMLLLLQLLFSCH